MPKTTRFVLIAFCLALTAVWLGEASAAAQGSGKGGKEATAAQSHWCRRLARKCVEGHDASCVAWGNYCADRAKRVKAKLWAPEKDAPPEVTVLLGDEPESAIKPPTEKEMNMSVGCRRLHHLCANGNHTACRVFANKCVVLD